MKLSDALAIGNARVVALAGAGGKTSSLYLLGRELAAEGRKVILAAAARMFPPEPGGVPLLLAGQPGILAERAAELLKTHNQIMAGAEIEDGKIAGLSCELLRELARLPHADVIIVEADGSRGLPIKFAAEYEPVICSADTLVVPVLGITALGAELNEHSFHRWELACKHLGIEYGMEITPDLAAGALSHPLSYGRFIGKNRMVLLLNQVDSMAQEEKAWAVARMLLAREGIDRVVIGAAQASQPVRAVIYRNRGEMDETQ